jgi:hypothetical protein
MALLSTTIASCKFEWKHQLEFNVSKETCIELSNQLVRCREIELQVHLSSFKSFISIQDILNSIRKSNYVDLIQINIPRFKAGKITAYFAPSLTNTNNVP